MNQTGFGFQRHQHQPTPVSRSLRNEFMPASEMRGFSLIEMMVVVAIIMITMGTALFQIGPIMKESSAQAALATTLGQMRRAHELAIDQRQVYRVTFTAPRTIQLDKVSIDADTKA